MNKKVILIGRHGNAPPHQPPNVGSMDTLFPASIERLHKIGQGLDEIVADCKGKTFVRHSVKKRTLYTAQAILIGALGMDPLKNHNHPPSNEQHLSNYDWTDINIGVAPALCYPEIYMNEDVYTANKNNPTENINFWLQNPDAFHHPHMASKNGGQLIIPYRVIDGYVKSCGKGNLGKLLGDEYDMGTIISHAGLSEVYIIGLINSGRKNPITDVKEIGGPFQMEELAILTFENRDVGKLEFHGQTFKVDLNKYMNS